MNVTECIIAAVVLLASVLSTVMPIKLPLLSAAVAVTIILKGNYYSILGLYKGIIQG